MIIREDTGSNNHLQLLERPQGQAILTVGPTVPVAVPTNLSVPYYAHAVTTSWSCHAGSGHLLLAVSPMIPPVVLGLSFALDSSSGPPCLHLSHSSLIVTFQGEIPDNHIQRVERSTMGSDPQVTLTLPQVCADVVITRGQYYWEVDVCNSTVYRIGVTSLDGATGWWMERRGSSFWAVYDRSQEVLHAVPPQIKTLGVFLNMGGGALSFHNPLTQERLATLPTRFGPTGVLPALGLGQGRLRLHCGLPPPPHVFLSRASAYRRPCGAGGGRWRRDVSFQSVRTVIQRFEELAVSDSDSGLVSSFGSSCSTLVSLSDQGGGVFHSGQGDHEAAAE
ncbi:cardiomyopathy-associated protein 5 [Polymixia lowei]